MNELPFVLPVGLLTADGRHHRGGAMRAATALDEIEPLGDERVRRNEAYYALLLLARVVTRLGPFAPVTPEVLGMLPAADFAYLQDLYANLNAGRNLDLPTAYAPPATRTPGPAELGLPPVIETDCPHCGATLELDLSEVSA